VEGRVNNVYDKVKLNRLIVAPVHLENWFMRPLTTPFRQQMYLIRAAILDSGVFRG
jgi:hypothetical protein